MPKDLLGREIRKGDYVVFHNLLYEVTDLIPPELIKMLLVEKLLSPFPIQKQANETCLVSKGEVTKWLLTKDNL